MQKCCLDEKRDMLTYLPDQIRSHIISFLPLKEAMRSSILSRQWEYICSSLSNLEFDQFDFEMKKCKKGDFRNFVDEVILRHDGSDIRRFSLRTEVDGVFISSRCVNTWISFALRHRVKDFEIRRYNEKTQRFSIPSFRCSTFTKLSLFSVNIEWPAKANFPMLKSFTLDDISFDDDNTVNRLFSSSTCPVLEDLILGHCVLNINTLSISIPTLKYLKVVNHNDIIINVAISRLQTFDYTGYNPPNICFEKLSSLSNVKFDFLGVFNSTDIGIFSRFNSVKTLMGLCHVMTLNLQNGFVEFLSRVPDLLECLPSSVWSLKSLHIGMFPTIIHIRVLKLLLRSYPNLETLHIYVVMKAFPFHEEIIMEEESQIEGLPPRDILSNLKTLEIEGFIGTKREVCLVRYLLKNAKFLEKLNIRFSHGKRSQQTRNQEWGRLNLYYPNLSISVF